MTIASKCVITLTSLSEKWRATPCRKLKFLVGLAALLALILVPALHGAQDEPVLKWHTYAGSDSDDQSFGIAMDSSGNIYFTGWSDATWGSPINPHSGGQDAFVAKLNSTGGLEWNTFMGSSNTDWGRAIAVDGSGNVYVVGMSDGKWSGEPFPGEGWGAFVAKLNSNGELQWHGFLPTDGGTRGTAVAVDPIGNVYVGGWGGWVWDTPPVEPLPDGDVAFVAKLNSSGVEVWHAFLGSPEGEFDGCGGLGVDVSGNVYVVGRSSQSWGTPINGHSGDEDVYVAKLNSNGFRQWNTFMGSSDTDGGWGIALDGSGNAYVSGSSKATWGMPVNPHGGGDSDAFAAKLDSNGVRQWHTFMGAVSLGWGIAVDAGQNVYLTGVWVPGGFVAGLNHNGILQWNVILDACLENIAVDGNHNFYVAGRSCYPWSTPVNPWAGGWDAFVAKISTQQTYYFSGFERPVDNPPIVNYAKAGSAIPVKWRITDLYGTPISDPASFQSLTSYTVSCVSFSGEPVDELGTYSPGSSGLQYLGDGYWQFNWKTPKTYAGQCRMMVLTLADQNKYTAIFHFK